MSDLEKIIYYIEKACSEIYKLYRQTTIISKEDFIKFKVKCNYIFLDNLIKSHGIKYFISECLKDRILLEDTGLYNLYLRPLILDDNTLISKFKIYNYSKNFERIVYYKGYCYYNDNNCNLSYTFFKDINTTFYSKELS